MAMLRDYQCDTCGYLEECWDDNPETVCLFCGGPMTRIITGTSFALPGKDTGFPTAADKWARRHRKANKTNLDRLGIPT